MWSCCLSQEYLKEEGRLSPEALRMVAELLNEQSLMFTALTEVLHLTADLSDNIRRDTTENRGGSVWRDWAERTL